jgi:hypothetical protein
MLPAVMSEADAPEPPAAEAYAEIARRLREIEAEKAVADAPPEPEPQP